MNYVLTNTSGALSEAIAAVIGRAVSATIALNERSLMARDYRKTVAELSALSDADLADIGLSRGTIRAAAYEATYG